MRISGRLSAYVFLSVLLPSFLAVGCTDPSATRRFASVAAVASERFAGIADDLSGSCERRERYRLLGGSESDLTSLGERTAASCAKYVKAAPRFERSHRVLVEYLTALGKLSSGGLVTYDTSLDEFARSLEQTDAFDTRSVDAVKRISEALMEAAAGKWRRMQLSSVIEKTNDDVQVLVAALRGIVAEDYAQLLDDESEAARKFYFGKIMEHGHNEPLAAVLVYEKWQGEEDAIGEKRNAADAYVKVLKRIASGHQDLYDHRNKLTSKELRKLALEHVAAIEELVEDGGDPF